MTQYTSRGYPTPEKTSRANVPEDMKLLADAVTQDVAGVDSRATAAAKAAEGSKVSYPTPAVSGWGVVGKGAFRAGQAYSWAGQLSRNGGDLTINANAFTVLGNLSGVTLPSSEGWGVAVCDGVSLGLQFMPSGVVRVWSTSRVAVRNGSGVQFSINWLVD